MRARAASGKHRLIVRSPLLLLFGRDSYASCVARASLRVGRLLHFDGVFAHPNRSDFAVTSGTGRGEVPARAQPWCRRSESNRHGLPRGHQILSLARLPIPPLRPAMRHSSETARVASSDSGDGSTSLPSDARFSQPVPLETAHGTRSRGFAVFAEDAAEAIADLPERRICLDGADDEGHEVFSRTGRFLQLGERRAHGHGIALGLDPTQ